MYIFLGVVGELLTIIGSTIIGVKVSTDLMIEISNRGYKIAKEDLEAYEGKYKNTSDISTFKKIVGNIIFFTPGVNMIVTAINGNKLKKAMLEDEEIKALLIPMTEEEKEQFKKAKTYFEKLVITAVNVDKKEDEEYVGMIGGKVFTVDHGLSSIMYDELTPLAYTLDEVKKLNDATTYSYRIGKLDGKNVAIVGIPNPDSPMKRIQLKKEDYKITHDYEIMSEEEAKDKTFIVYPFKYDDDIKEKLDKAIDEIIASRGTNTPDTKKEVSSLDLLKAEYEEYMRQGQPTSSEKAYVNVKRRR